MGPGRRLIVGTLLLGLTSAALAHNVTDANAEYVRGLAGTAIGPFIYLGAKHMVTGYDHLLYLVAIVFFVSNARDVALYVSLFAAGHSITLLSGVLMDWQFAPAWIDAIIGLSIVYKAIENLDGFNALIGVSPDPRLAVLGFGFCHGLGLATRLQQLAMDPEGLIVNLISFNIGVELGQLVALAMIMMLLPVGIIHDHARARLAINQCLMTGGFLLAGYHAIGALA